MQLTPKITRLSDIKLQNVYPCDVRSQKDYDKLLTVFSLFSSVVIASFFIIIFSHIKT